MLRILQVLLVAAMIWFAAGCSGDDDDPAQSGAGSGQAADDDNDDASPGDDDDDDNDDNNDDASPDCDATKRPIVFVHGVLEVGDAFAAQAMRLASNGYCLDRIYAFDYNSLFGPLGLNEKLDAFIDQVREATGAAQIDLLGHSLGGAVSTNYVSKAAYAAKVAHYVSLASFTVAEIQPSVAVLNLSSTADFIAGESQIPGAQNVVFDDLDHLQVATDAASFAEFYPFFNDGEAPATTEIVPTDQIDLSGRTLIFGVNDPAPNCPMNVYRIDPQTGERLTEAPEAVVTTDQNGDWNGLAVEPGAHYEFELLDPSGDWPPIHYYREPFPRSNNKVYFRVFPPANSLLGLAFKLLPYNDQWALLAYLNLNRSLVLGRDTMTLDGLDIAVPGIADPAATTIAMFFFDLNFNGVSDGAPQGALWDQLIFIRIYDLFLPSQPLRAVPFVFNGRTMAVRNWPSKTSGITIAVFE